MSSVSRTRSEYWLRLTMSAGVLMCPGRQFMRYRKGIWNIMQKKQASQTSSREALKIFENFSRLSTKWSKCWEESLAKFPGLETFLQELFGFTSLSERLSQFRGVFEAFSETDDETYQGMMASSKLFPIIFLSLKESRDGGVHTTKEENAAGIILGDFFTVLMYAWRQDWYSDSPPQQRKGVV